MPTVANTVIEPAIKGASVRVYLNASDTVNVLPTLTIGQKCNPASAAGNIGYISSIDAKGNSFQITPQYPNGHFESASPNLGILNTENITIV